MGENITTAPATEAQIAADAAKPAHRRVATVETNTDGRATIGKADTVHRATVVRSLNVYDESVGRTVEVFCGARRYRNTGGKGDTANIVPAHYDITCERCLAE